MYCVKCGTLCKDSYRFCPNCGTTTIPPVSISQTWEDLSSTSPVPSCASASTTLSIRRPRKVARALSPPCDLYELCLQATVHIDDTVTIAFVNERLHERELPTYCSSDEFPQMLECWNTARRHLSQRDVSLRAGLFFCLHTIIGQIPVADDVNKVLEAHITTVGMAADRMTMDHIHHLKSYAMRAFLVLSLVKAGTLEYLGVSWTMIRKLTEDQCKALSVHIEYLKMNNTSTSVRLYFIHILL